MILLCGFSRSGTSWLGKILDTNRSIVYWNEPDKKINKHLTFSQVDHCCTIDNEDMKNKYISAIEELFEVTDFNLNSPPYFYKDVYRINKNLYTALFFSGKILNKLYKVSYDKQIKIPFSLLTDDSIKIPLWKSVNQSSNLPFIKQTFPDIKIIYITRNPFDSIGSALKNQSMALDDQDTRRLLERKNSLYFKKNPISESEIDNFTEVQKKALLWRVENESAITFGMDNEDFYLITYENLVKNTHEEVRKIFKWLDIDFTQTTEDFISKSKSESKSLTFEKLLKKSYFGVYRSPDQININNRSSLTEKLYNEIDHVLKESFVLKLFDM